MFLKVLDEVEGVSEGVDSTGIRFSKPIKNYPYDMQTVISDYIDSVDAGLLNLINKVKNLSKEHFERYTICEASDKLIKDLKRDLKIDVSGYKNAINTNAIHHIIKRHGAGGKADSSMANDNDIARMRYIIENYDSFELLRDENGDIVYSEEFRNADNTQAPLIKLSKKINGTYYLIEAVPENKYKKIWVVSAYIKNSSVVTQAPKKSGSYLASPTSADNSISNSSKDVNDSSKNSLKQSLDWVEVDEPNVSLFEKVTEIGRINARMNAHILRIGSGLTRRVLSEVNIQKIARQLKGDYMSTVDIHKLTKTLTEYYQLLESGTISGEAAKIYTENIRDMLLNESKYMNPDISPAAKETLKEIKSTAISLNETQWKEVEASYGSRAAFRKVVGR